MSKLLLEIFQQGVSNKEEYIKMGEELEELFCLTAIKAEEQDYRE